VKLAAYFQTLHERQIPSCSGTPQFLRIRRIARGGWLSCRQHALLFCVCCSGDLLTALVNSEDVVATIMTVRGETTPALSPED
jgi:hypothetical protein